MGKYQKFEYWFDWICDAPSLDGINLTSYYDEKAEIVEAMLFTGLFEAQTPYKVSEDDNLKRAANLAAQMKNRELSETKDGGELMVRDFQEILQDNYEVPLYFDPSDTDFELEIGDEDLEKSWVHVMTHLDSLWQFYKFVRPKKIPTDLLIKLDVATLKLVVTVQHALIYQSKRNEMMIKQWNGKKSGTPKRVLREVCEHLYEKCYKNGKNDCLQDVVSFIKEMKNCINQEHVSFDIFIDKRIAEIKKTGGYYLIYPHERKVKSGPRRSVVTEPKPYSQGAVSTLLSRIRKEKNPEG